MTSLSGFKVATVCASLPLWLNSRWAILSMNSSPSTKNRETQQVDNMIKRTHLLFFVFFIVSMLFINGFSICKYAFADNGGKSMIIYFTWSGNSEVIAKKIQDKTGGDILKLEPVNPYPNDYHS